MEEERVVSPSEKMDWLLRHLYKTVDVNDGYVFESHITYIYNKSEEFRNFFKSVHELEFFFKALEEAGYLRQLDRSYSEFTVKGLNELIKLESDREKSVRCFVAMSFDPEETILFDEAIEPACSETGFKAIRIDRHHADADQTINDAMIAELKRSHFCIADFTKHKRGVYFEAGYALGRGMKVIYTCRKDHFDVTHFDTSHYQYLLYDTPDELRQMLVNKINAWIKD